MFQPILCLKKIPTEPFIYWTPWCPARRRGRQAAGYEPVRWAEAGRSVGVQSDPSTPRGRATGQLQGL